MENIKNFVEAIKNIQMSQVIDIVIAILIYILFRCLSKSLAYITVKIFKPKAKTKKEKEDVAKQGLEGSNLIGEEADENEEQKSKPGEEQASDSIKIADRIDMK